MPDKTYSPDEIEYALSTLEFYQGDVKAAARFLQMPAALLQTWYAKAVREAKRAAKPLETVARLRPRPPDGVLDLDDDDDDVYGIFIPAPEVSAFLHASFVAENAPLCNPHHEHLREANIAVLWTNVANKRGGNQIVGTAEMPGGGTGSKWAKEKAAYQMRQWFGTDTIDFLITLYAPYAADCEDAAFCALIEHELYHCAQRLDLFGEPAWSKEGVPLFSMKSHDVEEFVGVVARYGVGNGAGQTRALVDAANRAPTVAPADIAAVCGTCRR